ncbi:hypothetical protein K1719_033959 [Acacia pycnantha]|nr:hypothetical protein K1719_033959 [Acacia pycnantha]
MKQIPLTRKVHFSHFRERELNCFTGHHCLHRVIIGAITKSSRLRAGSATRAQAVEGSACHWKRSDPVPIAICG